MRYTHTQYAGGLGVLRIIRAASDRNLVLNKKLLVLWDLILERNLRPLRHIIDGPYFGVGLPA